MVIEQEGSLLLIDCGLMFPDADMHGIDLVLPDFTYLRENGHRIVGVVATHGHEDHVGALQYLLRELSFPVYGSALTLGLARNRIEEAGPARQDRADPGERRRAAQDRAVRRRVHRRHPLGAPRPRHRPAHPAGRRAPLRRLQARPHARSTAGAPTSHASARSPRRRAVSGLLMADSTNAEEHGHAPSETRVGGVLRALFAEHRGRRIITASFASHIHRVQQIIDAAIGEGRVVATLGLSMKKNVRLARDLGILRVPDASLIDIEDIDRHPPEKVCVISTGSQGEMMSALALLARGDSKWLKVGEHDTVILSSHAIPGNEMNVNRVIDGLLKAGAEVVHSGVADVHATGHAQADEIKTYLSIAQPEWYVPIHGEYRHLVANAKLGEIMGVPAGPRAALRGR